LPDTLTSTLVATRAGASGVPLIASSTVSWNVSVPANPSGLSSPPKTIVPSPPSMSTVVSIANAIPEPKSAWKM
jgi:hypothetical protein